MKQTQARTAGSAITSKRSLYMPSRQRGSSGRALPILDLCAKTWTEVSTTPRSFYPGKDNRYPLYVQGCASGPVWTDREKIAPIEFRDPERPVRSESVHRLRYSGCPIFSNVAFNVGVLGSEKKQILCSTDICLHVLIRESNTIPSRHTFYLLPSPR